VIRVLVADDQPMTPTQPRSGQRYAAGTALVLACGYGLLHISWALGGRWAYSACGRGDLTANEAATGCGARQVESLSAGQGWVAVALCALAAVIAFGALRRRRWAAPSAAIASLILLVLSFPLHLVFEIPTGLTGDPTDWRGIANRVVLLAGAFAFAFAVERRRCPHDRPPGIRPLGKWARRGAYAGLVLPVVGWALPHMLWVLDLRVGIAEKTLNEAQELSLGVQLSGALAPVLGGLLTVGLARPWGQRFPRWFPRHAGRRIPPPLAMLPAGLVAVALCAYGVIGMVVMTTDIAAGRETLDSLLTAWAVVGIQVVFLVWGVALAVATWGYHQATRCQGCS
jgi:hypothetical protein